jgi:hypothetical protein
MFNVCSAIKIETKRLLLLTHPHRERERREDGAKNAERERERERKREREREEKPKNISCINYKVNHRMKYISPFGANSAFGSALKYCNKRYG